MIQHETVSKSSAPVSFLQDPGVVVRPLRAADVPAIQYINDCGAMIASQVSARRADLRTWVADFLSEVIGVIAVVRDTPQTALVKQLAVHPSWHRRGVGQQLLLNAAEYLREQGVLKLNVDGEVSTDKAREALEAVGFQYAGERPKGGHRRLQFYLDLYRATSRRRTGRSGALPA